MIKTYSLIALERFVFKFSKVISGSTCWIQASMLLITFFLKLSTKICKGHRLTNIWNKTILKVHSRLSAVQSYCTTAHAILQASSCCLGRATKSRETRAESSSRLHRNRLRLPGQRPDGRDQTANATTAVVDPGETSPTRLARRRRFRRRVGCLPPTGNWRRPLARRVSLRRRRARAAREVYPSRSPRPRPTSRRAAPQVTANNA